MAAKDREPPRSSEELLERYVTGERKFSGADLSRAILRGVDLSGVDLSGANLSSADLSGSDLSGADLGDARLSRADLGSVDLRGADLRGANLRSANLIGTRGGGARLCRANLSYANLREVDFSEADLSWAHLTRANLRSVDFSGANLSRSDLGGAELAHTFLLDVDLSALCDARPSVEHFAPSTVDFKTIVRSLRSPALKDFLQRTGMPEVFIEYMIDCARTLDPLGVFRMLQSTFISYGGPDEPFARKLYDALHRNGVTTFFFPVHAKGGQKLRRAMSKGINAHDQVILVCSKNSLKRPGVLNEIEEVLQREARDGGREYLIPIRLDDYVFTGWKPHEADTARAVKDRVILDFVGADTDTAKFDAGLLRLISALRK